jgi:hypothetical protein
MDNIKEIGNVRFSHTDDCGVGGLELFKVGDLVELFEKEPLGEKIKYGIITDYLDFAEKPALVILCIYKDKFGYATIETHLYSSDNCDNIRLAKMNSGATVMYDLIDEYRCDVKNTENDLETKKRHLNSLEMALCQRGAIS